jgi:hypothetical protein
MRILLLGEYSNVHATLAEGLRRAGHEVTVASDGDGWKNYPRDIDLRRPEGGHWTTLRYVAHLWRLFYKHFRHYDIVQLINPVFLPLKAERHNAFYRYLRHHNGALFLGAFGMDYYYATTALDGTTFRYSDFNLGTKIRHSEENDIWMQDWVYGAKGRLNQKIARDCEGIIAGLYEYYIPYQREYSDRLTFIPFPIRQREVKPKAAPRRIRFFIGIQRARTAYKGTDIMLRALERVVHDYPEDCEMVRVESLPFAEYRRRMLGSDVILDQLYSYTPGMNALEAMAQGLVVVGGGEPENYEILDEKTLRPIINVEPTEESVYQALCHLVHHKEEIPRLSAESIQYITQHHDVDKVATRYLTFWQQQMRRRRP